MNANIQPSPGTHQEEDSYAHIKKEGGSQPPTPTSKPSELDHMLGSLETDMRGQGVSVSTKGLCGACAKPVVGQVSVSHI